MMKDLDSSLLRAFVTVVETGAVSAAADRLARTQAAVSMQLRRLEDDLGQRLLDRSPRGVHLTEAGHLLLPYARAILGAGSDARRALGLETVAGTVRLGLIEDIALGRLPRSLREFRTAYPQVLLDLVVEDSTTLSRRLAEGSLDLVIGDPLFIEATARVIWDHPLRWVSARGFVIAPREPVPVVAYGAPCLWQRQALAGLDRAGIAWRAVCSSTSVAAVQSATEAGLGLSVLLEGNIRHETMRVAGAADGLPEPGMVSLALFAAAGWSERQAVAALERFLAADRDMVAGALRTRTGDAAA